MVVTDKIFEYNDREMKVVKIRLYMEAIDALIEDQATGYMLTNMTRVTPNILLYPTDMYCRLMVLLRIASIPGTAANTSTASLVNGWFCGVTSAVVSEDVRRLWSTKVNEKFDKFKFSWEKSNIFPIIT